MHAGRSYTLPEFLQWTRRSVYRLLVIGTLPVLLYQTFDWKWVAIPWTAVALVGTATAFIVGFKNTQTYNRTWEARQIWGAILNTSRGWGASCRAFLVPGSAQLRPLVQRHLAWLTALRYQMREPRPWENAGKSYNAEYQRRYEVPEHATPLEQSLAGYLEPEELSRILATRNRAAQLMAMQAFEIAQLHRDGHIEDLPHIELQRLIRDLLDHQGRSERIKNFPYPRQFATINAFFIHLFSVLLPFGMLRDFDEMNERLTGVMRGHAVWLVIPFSLLISWVFAALEQVGESTENPFEGGANDVPITQMSRTIEIDLLEMLGDTDLPPAMQPQHHILL